MPFVKSQRLRIPSHYYVYCDPPDKSGDEVLHFVSPQRHIKLKGFSFREFVQHVVPMLDGRHALGEIHAEVADLFDFDDLVACFDLLAEQGVIEDTGQWSLDGTQQEKLRPQLNLFHDLSPEPWKMQQRLTDHCVTVIGLTSVGVAAARALSAAGVGRLRAVDPESVTPADVYFNPEFSMNDCGRLRVDALRPHITSEYEGIDRCLTSDEAVSEAIHGADFLVNCLDEGNLSLAYRLNRVALRTRARSINVSASGFEAIVGPTVYPGETACYMCYRMRLLACTDNPETAYDFESFLDRRKKDDSPHRANLVMNSAIAGQLAAIEVLKELVGISSPTTRGRIVVIDLRDLSSTMHTVLRKPWCPACTTVEKGAGI